MTDVANPIFVKAFRGDIIETRHRGSAIVMKADGTIVGKWGDVDEPMFLRSSTKPLQGIPLVESGTADRFNFSDKEIALACASHSAEEKHEDTLRALLERIGFSADDLECGPPMAACDNNVVLARRGIKKALPIHNNCSGQHVAFLAMAKHLDLQHKGYIKENHPIQLMVAKTLGEMAGTDMGKASMAIEGCGIPVFAFTRKQAALSYARFATPSSLPAKRAEAVKRITKAMMSEPEYFGGNKCFDTTVTGVLGNVICKEGSQGTQIAIIPTLGLGVVLKIEDGSAMVKQVSMGAILTSLGLVDDKQQEELRRFFTPEVKNSSGEVVGIAKPVDEWISSLKEQLAR
ncbi:MAG: asparaginase [Alphaproteobacteria bacterium]|nr:asparaginase [Alphaproteobacteria bacterium]